MRSLMATLRLQLRLWAGKNLNFLVLRKKKMSEDEEVEQFSTESRGARQAVSCACLFDFSSIKVQLQPLFFLSPFFRICSEEDAKKSIYSVSTKYYYAFGCKVPEDFAYKIRCNIVTFFHQVYLSLIVVFLLKVEIDKTVFRFAALPNVKWVLPDSYLCHGESGYGGTIACSVFIFYFHYIIKSQINNCIN